MEGHATPYDWIVAIIAVGALAIGLISMAVGWVADRRPRREEAPPTRRRRPIMSRPASMRQRVRRYGVVSIPVSGMAYQAGGMVSPRAETPDMDAENPGMPRLSRAISDGDLIAFLAVVRGKDGKHRYTANAIFALVGGDRNAVLARIKEIRAGPPQAVYPPRTPEQQQLRSELGLG